MDLVELGGIAGPIDLDLGLQDFNVDTIYKVHGKFSAALGSGTRPSTAPM